LMFFGKGKNNGKGEGRGLSIGKAKEFNDIWWCSLLTLKSFQRNKKVKKLKPE
jgi:hypothetical protein